MSSNRIIRIGYAPDLTDAFKFYSLIENKISAEGYTFEPISKDIQSLNEWALQGDLEVSTASVHAYAYLQDRYAMLSSGGSMGGVQLAHYVPDPQQTFLKLSPLSNRSHGPQVISRKPMSMAELKTTEIAIPGKMTSGYLGLRLALGEFKERLMPLDAILLAVMNGDVNAGLILHEDPLLYTEPSLHGLLDLGQWWYQQTRPPLPLRCTLIRRDLGREAIESVSRMLQESVLYALTHREEAFDYALPFGEGLDRNAADTCVAVHVNQWTYNYGPKGRQGIMEFLTRGSNADLCPAVTRIDFV